MTNYKKNLSIKETYQKSFNVKPVKFNTKKKRVLRPFWKKAIAFIVISSLSYGIALHVTESQNEKDLLKSDQYQNICNSIMGVADNNYHSNYSNCFYAYDIDTIASDILKSPDYDIDTRIYGFYKDLDIKRYQNEDAYMILKINKNMDSLFQSLSRIIGENPSEYSESELKSCLFDSFQEYLESKGIKNLNKYEEIMDDILKLYAKSDIHQKELDDKLNELNNKGGSR